MSVPNVTEDLLKVAPRARVLAGDDMGGHEIDGLRPAAVVQPADAEGVAAALRFASERGLAVIPRGGGTAIELGNRPTRLDLVLDLRRLNRIVEHRPQDLTVTVEAGVALTDLQAALGSHGQMLALDPPLESNATVGGVLAANGFGPRRHRYGTARDLLIGSRVLLADGTPVRSGGKVVKNVAGYDLNKLWIGSVGTLAVITEATFRVIPLPAGFGMLIATFPSVQAAHSIAVAAARSQLQPLSLDLIGPTAAQGLIEGGRQSRDDQSWLLAVEVAGAVPMVDRTLRELRLMVRAGGSTTVAEAEEAQRERLMQRIRDYGRSPDDRSGWILRLSVLPTEVAEVILAIEEESGGLQAAIVARAGSGVVYCHGDGWDDENGTTLVRRLRERIGRRGGSVVAERAPAAAKAGFDVWGIEGSDAALMRQIKRTYDPADVLSPGRLL